MPAYRGIKLDVISQLELRIHPEFPHPESSQFTYRSTSTTGETSSSLVSSSVSSDSKADKILGRPSTISVYIPSHPGARFWLRYNVSGATGPKAPWYYFKLFMNGRHINSWGTHSIFKPQGQVMRALYDPTPRWNYKIGETVYKNCGNEIRPFYFSNVKGCSAADDGGLIEVRVFRAKGRRRSMPSPAEFKPQDHYGLVLPSTGLTEDYQEIRCYDWFLIDPTDRPFANFKFHYRSWDNLSSLHLIPSNHPRNLLLPSPSLLSLNGQSTNALRRKDALKRGERDRSRDSAGSFSSNAPDTPPKTPLERDTYDDESDSSREDVLSVPRSPSPYYRNLSPAALEALGYLAPPIPQLPSSAQLERTDILKRPLPEIPCENPVSRSFHRVSESPDAITPSLRSRYCDYVPGAFFPSPIAETAAAVQSRKTKHPPELIGMKRQSTQENPHTRTTDHPVSLPILLKQQRGGIFSGTKLWKHRNSTPIKHQPATKMTLSDRNTRKIPKPREYRSQDDDMTPILFTESEWLSNMPFTSIARAKQKEVGRTRDLAKMNIKTMLREELY